MSKHEQITIQPGRWTTGGLTGEHRDERPVRFMGRELARWSDGGPDDTRRTTWTVYETEGGRIVVVEHYQTRWEGETSYRSVHTFDALDDVPALEEADYEPEPGAIPECLRVMAEEALGIDPAIDLDAPAGKWTLYLHADRARAGLRERITDAADAEGISPSEWIWRACEAALGDR